MPDFGITKIHEIFEACEQFKDFTKLDLILIFYFMSDRNTGTSAKDKSLTEISNILGQNKSNVHRSIKKLWDCDILIKKEDYLGQYDKKLRGFIICPHGMDHGRVKDNYMKDQKNKEMQRMNQLYKEAYKRKIGIKEMIAETENRAKRVQDPKLLNAVIKINDEANKITGNIHNH